MESHTSSRGGLILPAVIKMVKILHRSKDSKEIWKFPLSNDTVANRIYEISNGIFE